MSFYQQIAGQRRSNSAFTLFELIGVLAIISIILAMVAPMTLQMLKLQRQQADKAALPEIAQALKLAMLREQSFPSTSSWWDMVARHGAGSANEIRYSDNQQSVERRLYFADSGLNGDTFFDIVSGSGAAGQWLIDFDDPSELRLLLLSTINPDLDLPNTVDLTAVQFNAIWSDWSNAPGAPTASDVGSFGLTAAWEGRAGELNIERIDLRDFLCQVAIENAYYASGFYDSSGQLRSFSASDFGFSATSDYLQATVQIGTGNLSGAKVALNLSNSSIVEEPVTGPPVGTTYHQATQLHSSEPVLVLNAGRVIDEEKDANIIIRLQSVDENGPGSSTEYTFTVYDEDGSKNRSPIDLIHPSGGTNHPLSFTDRYSKRYFLSGQTLLLGIPWTSPVQPAGTVPITENQSTIRFDGLSWHY